MNSPRGRTRSFAAFAATAACGVALTLMPGSAAFAQQHATTDGTPAIDAAITAGDWSAALSQLDTRIASNPRDVQAQFKRGTVLAHLNRDSEAIEQFEAITRAYPELPEPYNNLAALYAKAGRYDDARSALVTALKANPSYTLAYENLGDLYLRLAAESYKRAQALGHASGATAQRLAGVQAVIAAPVSAAHAGAPAEPRSVTTLPLEPSFQFGTPSGPLSVPYVAPSN
jgi:tetratricopeptide (TPR) repeat protein